MNRRRTTSPQEIDRETPLPRRTVPRQPVNWNATYQFRDEQGEWRLCVVSDISATGAGLHLVNAMPEPQEGQRVDIVVKLSGIVRNRAAGTNRGLRVGIEFEDVSGEAWSFVQSLRDSGVRW